MLSDDIKKAIRGSGMTLSAIAEATGVAQPILSRFLDASDNHRDIRLERTADRLAEYFGLELTERKKRKK